jgi:outer membrane protein, heavy metal efflux system
MRAMRTPRLYLAASVMLATAVNLPGSLNGADARPEAVDDDEGMVTLSIEELVAGVVMGNPELAFYRAELAAAQGGRKSAAEWENPELSTDLGHKQVRERSGPKLGDGVAWSVALAQTFEFPGRLELRKAIANRQIELARLGLERAEAALSGRARALGFAFSAAEERAAATREVAARFEALAEVLVQRDMGGVTPLLDQRILEANTITLNRRASRADQEWQQAMITLNQLRGQSATRSFRLTGVDFLPTNAPSTSVLLETARTHSFEVRWRQVELEQQGFEVDLRKNERWPSVTLAPFYAEERAADQERTVGLGISVPLPLWNRNGGAIEVAEARRRQASASLSAVLLEIEARVTAHALALESQVAEIRRWRSNAPQQFREAAELADRHYRMGAVPVTTYVEMQLQYLEALEALLATRGEALEHWQQLELLVGHPLETRH